MTKYSESERPVIHLFILVQCSCKQSRGKTDQSGPTNVLYSGGPRRSPLRSNERVVCTNAERQFVRIITHIPVLTDYHSSQKTRRLNHRSMASSSAHPIPLLRVFSRTATTIRPNQPTWNSRSGALLSDGRLAFAPFHVLTH